MPDPSLLLISFHTFISTIAGTRERGGRPPLPSSCSPIMTSSYPAGFRSVASFADDALKSGRSLSLRRSASTRSAAELRRSKTLSVDVNVPQREGVRPTLANGRVRSLFSPQTSSMSRRGHDAHSDGRVDAPASRFANSLSENFSVPGLRLDADPSASTATEDSHGWCVLQPGRAWLYPELPWGAPHEWQSKRMPGKTFLFYWDIVTFLACLYVAIAVPYLAGFVDRADWGGFGGDAKNEDTCIFTNIGKDCLRTAILVVDMIADLIFWVDIVLSFHLARWVICREGRLHHVLIDDLPSIRRMYLKGNFCVDLLGQIPWQYADCLGTGPGLKLLRLFRMMKMLRYSTIDCGRERTHRGGMPACESVRTREEKEAWRCDCTLAFNNRSIDLSIHIPAVGLHACVQQTAVLAVCLTIVARACVQQSIDRLHACVQQSIDRSKSCVGCLSDDCGARGCVQTVSGATNDPSTVLQVPEKRLRGHDLPAAAVYVPVCASHELRLLLRRVR